MSAAAAQRRLADARKALERAERDLAAGRLEAAHTAAGDLAAHATGATVELGRAKGPGA